MTGSPDRAEAVKSRRRRRQYSFDDYNATNVAVADHREPGGRLVRSSAPGAHDGNDDLVQGAPRRRQSPARRTRLLHTSTDRTARHPTFHELQRTQVEAMQLPDKALVDVLLQAFFVHVNPGFPVVDENRFMAQYNSRDREDSPSILLMQAILLVGAHVACNGREREDVKGLFFRRAKTLLDWRLERNREVVIQAALLLAWQTDGSEDAAAGAYYWVGTATIIATGLGLHRDAEDSSLDPHKKRLWRRLFWLLFQRDVLVSMQYGRPQALHIEECDVQPLQPSDFEQCGPNVQSDFVIQMTDLCVLISEALRNRFGPTTDPQQQRHALQDADDALAQWSLQLPEGLRLRPTLSLDLHSSILHLTYSTALILLHRPLPETRSAEGGTRPEDAEICSAAAGVVRGLMERLRQKGLAKSLWGSCVHAISMALTQLSVEARFSDAILAEEALRHFDAALFTLRELVEYWPDALPTLRSFERSRSAQRASRRGENSPRSDNSSLSPDSVSSDRSVAPSEASGKALVSGNDPSTPADESAASCSEWKSLFPFDALSKVHRDRPMPWQEWRDIYLREPVFDLSNPDVRWCC